MLEIQKRLTNFFYITLSLPSTAMGFALSVQISALSWILGTKYGLQLEDIGLVWAAGPIAGIFGQVFFGVWSDNVWLWGGRRRPFIIVGGVLAALSLLALPNLEIVSGALGIEGILGVAIAVALALDMSINVGFNPTRSIIADVTPEGEKRTKGYTWMQTISGTFGMLAYVIGAVLGKTFLIYFGAILVLFFTIVPPFFIEEPKDFEKGEDGNKTSLREGLWAIKPLWGFLIYACYRVPVRIMDWEVSNYYVEIACFVLTVILIGYTLMQPESSKFDSVQGDLKQRRRQRFQYELKKTSHKSIGFQKVLAAHSFTWIGIQAMFIYMFSFLKYRFPDHSGDEVGRVIDIAFLILNGVAAVLPAFVLEPITRKIGRVKTHWICIAIMAIGYAGVWLIGYTPIMIYILMAILGVGWAATVSLPFAIMSQKVDQAKMGLYMGLFNLSVVLPQLVASLGVGEYISRVEDKSLVFVICAITLGISAVAWTLVREEEGEGNIQPASGSGH